MSRSCVFNSTHLSRVVDHDADLFVPVALGQSPPPPGIGIVVFAVVLVQSLQSVGDAGRVDLFPAELLTIVDMFH